MQFAQDEYASDEFLPFELSIAFSLLMFRRKLICSAAKYDEL